ncbi:hypothetical protein Cadr_000028648 [Camelus dromedarius]|uniref:Uncharacterized protein n=1 Tax=Camelus dromedarius TaxID=9838 RepID=A0A5N4CJ51_CAMDR|nr:hypothetical protein Cadr_000028648 [Camelus dromedarius]
MVPLLEVEWAGDLATSGGHTRQAEQRCGPLAADSKLVATIHHPRSKAGVSAVGGQVSTCRSGGRPLRPSQHNIRRKLLGGGVCSRTPLDSAAAPGAASHQRKGEFKMTVSDPYLVPGAPRLKYPGSPTDQEGAHGVNPAHREGEENDLRGAYFSEGKCKRKQGASTSPHKTDSSESSGHRADKGPGCPGHKEPVEDSLASSIQMGPPDSAALPRTCRNSRRRGDNSNTDAAKEGGLHQPQGRNGKAPGYSADGKTRGPQGAWSWLCVPRVPLKGCRGPAGLSRGSRARFHRTLLFLFSPGPRPGLPLGPGGGRGVPLPFFPLGWPPSRGSKTITILLRPPFSPHHLPPKQQAVELLQLYNCHKGPRDGFTTQLETNNWQPAAPLCKCRPCLNPASRQPTVHLASSAFTAPGLFEISVPLVVWVFTVMGKGMMPAGLVNSVDARTAHCPWCPAPSPPGRPWARISELEENKALTLWFLEQHTSPDRVPPAQLPGTGKAGFLHKEPACLESQDLSPRGEGSPREHSPPLSPADEESSPGTGSSGRGQDEA